MRHDVQRLVPSPSREQITDPLSPADNVSARLRLKLDCSNRDPETDRVTSTNRHDHNTNAVAATTSLKIRLSDNVTQHLPGRTLAHPIGMHANLPVDYLQEYGGSVLRRGVDGKPPRLAGHADQSLEDMVLTDIVDRQARLHEEGVGEGVWEILASCGKGHELPTSFRRDINEFNTSALKEGLEASDEAIFSTRRDKSS